MASFKKHLESNHPEMISDPANQNFEACCTIISHQENAIAPAKKDESNKINALENESLENKPEDKKIKKQTKQPEEEQEKPVPSVVKIQVQEKKELINYPATINSMPIHQDIIPLTYSGPYTFGNQNYNLMCIMQSQAPSFPANNQPSSFDWMHKLATTQSQNASTAQLPFYESAPKESYHQIQEDIKLPNQETHPYCQPQQNSSLEKRIQELPTDLNLIMSQNDHHHIHCEYCGHCTIMHNGHIDYVHDAELHHYSHSGIIFTL